MPLGIVVELCERAVDIGFCAGKDTLDACRSYEGDPVAGSTLHHIEMIMTLDETNQIIVNAF